MAFAVLAGSPPTTDITNSVMAGSLRVENSGGAQLATCTFDVVDKAGTITVLVPEGEVKVTDGGVTIFQGLIKSRTRIRAAGDPKKRYRIGCQDYTSLLTDDVIDDLNTRQTTESDKQRIEYWLTTYGTRGVTTGATIQTISGAMPPQEPGGMTLYEAVADVCKLTSASFYVGFDKALHYFVTETSASSWDFSDSPNYTTSFPYREITLPDDTVELVNAVFVIGQGVTSWRTHAGSIASYGRREGTVRDTTLLTTAQCDAAGDAYLAIRALPRQSATIKYRKPGLIAGQTIHVTDARWSLAFVQFTVAKVTASVLSGGAVEYEAQLTDGVIDLATLIGTSSDGGRKALATSALSLQYAAESLGRVKVVAVLPTLPDTDYPVGQLVLLTTDQKLYRNTDGSTWSVAVAAVDMTGQITTTQISPEAISTPLLAAGAVEAGNIAAGAVTADAIMANAVVAGKIDAGAVTSQALASEIVLADKLLTTSASGGARVEIDDAGIRNYNASDKLMVRIPTTGEPVTVVGEIEASSLVSTSTAELRGATSLVGGSVMTAQVGVTNPTTAPTITVTTPSQDIAALAQPGHGLCYDSSGFGSQATYLIGADPTTGNLLDMWYEVKASDGTLLRTIRKTGTDSTATTTLGSTSYITDTWTAYSGTSNSQIGTPLTMPRDGTITKVAGRFSGYSGSATCKMAIWNTSGTIYSGGSSASFSAASVATGGTNAKYEKTLTTPRFLASGTTFWAGFLHTSSGDGFWWWHDDGSGKTTKRGDGLDGSMTGIETDSSQRPNVYVTYEYTVSTSEEGTTGKIIGIARQGTNVWVLDANGWLFQYNQADGDYLGKFDLSANIAGTKANAGLFWDGTNLIITTATGVTGTDQVRFIKVSTAGAWVSNHATTGNAINGSTATVRGGWYESGTAYWASVNGVAQPYSNSTYAYIANADFGQSSELVSGVNWNGTQFLGWSTTSPTKVWKYTSWNWTTESAVYWISYAWYDSNATGGTHETAVSPRYSLTLGRRRQMQVSQPVIPVGGTDDPDKVRIYMERGASDPGGTNYKRQVEDALTTRTFTTFNSGGGANVSSNTFAAGTAAELKSLSTGWNLYGDGIVKMPNLRPTTVSIGSTNVTVTTGSTFYFVTGAETSFTAQYVGQMFRCEFSGSCTVGSTSIAHHRLYITDGSNSLIADLGRVLNEGAGSTWFNLSLVAVWTADSTATRKLRLMVSNSASGIVVTTEGRLHLTPLA